MTTAVVAVCAAGFAGVQLREVKRTREDQTRPYVVVDVQPGSAVASFLNLVVENIGSTPARDVQITFDPPIEQSGTGPFELAESGLLADGIRMMPPGRRVTALFDVAHERMATDLPMQYDVTVRLNDARGRRQPEQHYTIDLSYMRGFMYVEEFGIHDAAKALKELNKTTKKWTGSRGRLQVGTTDEDLSSRRTRIEYDLTGHRPSLGRPSPPEWQLALARNVSVRSVVRRFREWRASRSA